MPADPPRPESHAAGSTHGAPTTSKGVGVPRPSDIETPSKSPNPG